MRWLSASTVQSFTAVALNNMAESADKAEHAPELNHRRKCIILQEKMVSKCFQVKHTAAPPPHLALNS